MGTRARLRELLASLAISLAAACAGADGAGGAARDGAGGGEKGARTMRVVRSERSVEVAVGEGIDVVVSRPVGIPEQLQCEWPASPRVEGAAVRFVRRRIEAPPPEDDGGVTTLHYELEALSPGAARVALEPREAGPEARCRSVTVEVLVRGSTTP